MPPAPRKNGWLCKCYTCKGMTGLYGRDGGMLLTDKSWREHVAKHLRRFPDSDIGEWAYSGYLTNPGRTREQTWSAVYCEHIPPGVMKKQRKTRAQGE